MLYLLEEHLRKKVGVDMSHYLRRLFCCCFPHKRKKIKRVQIQEPSANEVDKRYEDSDEEYEPLNSKRSINWSMLPFYHNSSQFDNTKGHSGDVSSPSRDGVGPPAERQRHTTRENRPRRHRQNKRYYTTGTTSRRPRNLY